MSNRAGRPGVVVIDPQREAEKKKLYEGTRPGKKGDSLYYAVARGKMVGVVKGWDHVEPHITGLKKPVCYRSFTSETEAWAWLTETKKKLMRKLKKTRRVTRTRPKPGGAKGETEDYETDEDYTSYEESSAGEQDSGARAPRRAPPPPPKKIDEKNVETSWMGPQKYTTDKVWLVEEDAPPPDDLSTQVTDVSLSSTPVEAKYEILSTLGRGAFSIVKLAKHKQSSKQFALKVLSAVSDPEFSLERTAKEIEIMKLLSTNGGSPNVVSFSESFQLSDKRVLVLELLESGGLFNELASNNDKYTEEEARKLVAQLLNAVSFIHQHNVVHRDIVPENLLLSGKGLNSTLKLAGFSMSSISPAQTPFDGLVGTPSIQPPEIANRQHFSKASDMWSLGVIAYALLSGKFPFQDGNAMRLNVKIRKGEYDTSSTDWTNVSSTAKDFIKQLICVDVTKRFTAEQAKQHVWIKNEVKNAPNLPTFRSNIQASVKNNVWN